MSAYVYLICHSLDDGCDAGPVKVGIAAAPWARLQELQTGNPRRLVIYAAFRSPSRLGAIDVERTLHARLSEYRMVGEWFDLIPCDAFNCILEFMGVPLPDGTVLRRESDMPAILAEDRRWRFSKEVP